MNDNMKYFGDDTVIISGYVQRDTPLNLISEIKLSIAFPGNSVGDKNVVITREAIKHISSSGQYKKIPKVIMEYMPRSGTMYDGVMYINELEIVRFRLED